MRGDEPPVDVGFVGTSGVFPACAGMNHDPGHLALAALSVFPACAGMNRSFHIFLNLPESVPRVRGDEPMEGAFLAAGLLVFPACAGMNHIQAGVLRNVSGVPRVRGDEPMYEAGCTYVDACSPRARG